MKPESGFEPVDVPRVKQRGVVLFFTLIALLVMSLAAVALIRSVDTSTLIAGNLSFKQAATNSTGAAFEAASDWLAQTETANATINVNMDGTHPFNKDAPTKGYYSGSNPAANLTDGSTLKWDITDSFALNNGQPDASGNTARYVIHRLCRNSNMTLANADCLFSGAELDMDGQEVPYPDNICKGPFCPTKGQSPIIRITVQTKGPHSTVSYAQMFID